MEQESECKLSFLDTEITHHEDGSLSTTVYRKKTHTDKYLSFDSHHRPLSHKVSVARTLFCRAEKVCSTVDERDDERKHVTDTLRATSLDIAQKIQTHMNIAALCMYGQMLSTYKKPCRELSAHPHYVSPNYPRAQANRVM